MNFVNAKEIRALTDYKEAIDYMRDALIDIAQKKSKIPDRIHLHDGENTYLFMPVLSSGLGYSLCKYVGVCPKNGENGLPVINGLVLLIKNETGIPLMLFDGAEITAIRTGALGGVSYQTLCMDGNLVCSLFGYGVQAKTQLEALLTVRKIDTVYLFARNVDKAEKFADEFRDRVEITVTNDIGVLSESDVIIAATNSKYPLFKLSDVSLKKHVHITAIGSFRPDMQEIDAAVYRKFNVFTDNKVGCIAESGDLIRAINDGLNIDKVVNLGEVLEKNDFSDYKYEQTIFKSVGNAVFDLYFSLYVYKKMQASCSLN